MDSRQFQSTLKGHSEHALINLRLGERTETVVLKELQRDRVRRSLIHVDFQRVRMDTEITVDVEIALEGNAPGVAEGGILEFLARALHVRALPANMPETLPIDISELGIGESIHVRELSVPKGVTILTDEDTVIVTIAAPRLELEEEPEAESAESAEPERIGRKAEEDE
jgi:large subunit ribosomal protein L25